MSDASLSDPGPGPGPGPGRPWMVLGTASDVGKSAIATGLCRWLRRLGEDVAPFKAQNMSLNSFVTVDGGEIGWAQAVQAAACGRLAESDHNPVLIKPVASVGSQVIVQGHLWRDATHRECRNLAAEVWPRVCESFERVRAGCGRVVLEGAGAAAELNLANRDIANFRMARHADADVILVADIERGGVFASVVGTLQLLSESDRARVRGIIVNKFRGDPEFFADGVALLQERSGVPVLGVLPFFDAMALPPEDSMSLNNAATVDFEHQTLNIVVVRLPHLANFTDFTELEREPGVCLRYATDPHRLQNANVIILPGTKSTLHDLAWLRSSGWAAAIGRFTGELVGICGGFQMLGESVSDPYGVDGPATEAPGLGYLPIRTRMAPHKTLQQVQATCVLPNLAGSVSGYEIHMGQSTLGPGSKPAFLVGGAGHVDGRIDGRVDGRIDGRVDGCVDDAGRVWGTYLHGLFSHPEFRQRWVTGRRGAKGLRPTSIRTDNGQGALGSRSRSTDPYDAWTDFMQEYLDLSPLLHPASAT